MSMLKTLVADVLNDVLGDYVENLDPQQLTLGIWGGDVKLEGLRFKKTALDEFGFPFKVEYGSLDTLVIKIPWNDIWSKPTVAKIEGLQAIIVPSRGVPYDEETVTSRENEMKQKALNRLENNRRKIRKPEEPIVSSTLAERIATQVVNNLQVTIEKIHLRYEDQYSCPERPFAAGVTLESLSFTTTDADFKHKIHTEAVKLFHKLVRMKSLAIYLNTRAGMISSCPSDKKKRDLLQSTISTEANKPKTFSYLFGPISSTAKVTLNPKPESDGTNWRTPKIDILVEMGKMAMALDSRQYKAFIALLDAIPRFSSAEKYRKHRPNLIRYKGNYMRWWKFIYDSVRDEVVERRKENWTWANIKKHVDLVESYREAWVTFRTQKHVPESVLDLIRSAEKKLDLFNLDIARQQAEMRIDRLELKRVEDHEVQGWIAWGASWLPFGPKGATVGEKNETNLTTDRIVAEVERAWDSEEKKKLFAAIDYQENMRNEYPADFVAHRIKFELGLTEVVVDDSLMLRLRDFNLNADHNPSSSNVGLRSSMQMDMITCKAGIQRREILRRTSFTLDGFINQKEKSFLVSSDAMNFNITSTAIRLISSVTKCFFTANKEEEAPREEKSYRVPHYGEISALWSVHELFNRLDPKHITEAQNPSPSAEKLTFSVGHLTVTVGVDDESVTEQQLLLFESRINATIEAWSANLSVDAALWLQLSYYNLMTKRWDPIIEQNEVKNHNKGDDSTKQVSRRGERQWKKWHMVVKLRTSRGKDMKRVGIPLKRLVKVEAHDVLNLTVTKSLIQLSEKLIEIWKSTSSDPPKEVTNRVDEERAEEWELEINLRRIAISLVDNDRMLEVLNMTIAGPGLVWEFWEKTQYRPMPSKIVEPHEIAYQEWMKNGMPDQNVTVNNQFQVNFKHWIGKDSTGKITMIRRSNHSGFWMLYKRMIRQDSMHLKINKLQVDNQLPACTFQVALAAISPPATVAPRGDPDPFIELSMLVGTKEGEPTVTEIKQLNLGVQEFAAKIDMGLITSLMSMMPPPKEGTKTNKSTDASVKSSSRHSSKSGDLPKIYFRSLSISPVALHLSFSQWMSSCPTERAEDQFNIFSTLLRSVGITITDFDDVVFQLAHFNCNGVACTRPEFINKAYNHYKNQFLGQLYRYLLGLDLIGNPIKLAGNISTGVEDLFYQPYKGATAGIDEFGQGLALGFKSLFSNVVGGTTGAVSRITGTIGRGVAVLTMDEEYQRKRQDAINKQQQHGFGDGVVKGAKGLLQGIGGGIGGLFTKPVEGWQKGGVGGLAAGVGKGVVGLVTRPVVGVVDAVGGTFNGLTTTISGAGVQPVRPPRNLKDPETGYKYRPFC